MNSLALAMYNYFRFTGENKTERPPNGPADNQNVHEKVPPGEDEELVRSLAKRVRVLATRELSSRRKIQQRERKWCRAEKYRSLIEDESNTRCF